MKIKQFFLITFISVFIGFLLGTIFGIVIGTKINSDNRRELVSSTVVLDKLHEQSFLVTRTLVTDQEMTIEIDYDSPWSQFFWGHQVTANGIMQVDLGVDLSKLGEDDIEVDHDSKTIKISLPDTEVYETSLEGPIEVSTKSGIFKKLFDSNDNEDYNLALSELKKQAETSTTEDEELMSEAQSSALSTLQAIFKDTGYTVSE